MTTPPISVQATPVITLSVDLVSLLQAGDLLDYNEDTGESRYAPDFLNQIVKAAAASAAREVLKDDLKKAIGEQIRQQVAETVQAALDAPVQETDRWGTPTGEAKPLRAALADQAAEQVRKWVKASDRFSNGTEFDKFLQREVDSAIRNDLNEVLKVARADVKKRMEQAAAKAIVDAAASAVKGL